jgi:WD40 repeat protein
MPLLKQVRLATIMLIVGLQLFPSLNPAAVAERDDSTYGRVESQSTNVSIMDVDWNAQDQLALGYADGLVEIVDTNGNVSVSKDLGFEQHAILVSLAWDSTLNSSVIAASILIDTYSLIRLWNTTTNQIQEIAPHHKVGQLEWSSDGTKLASISFSGLGYADYKYVGIWAMPLGTPQTGVGESNAFILAMNLNPANSDLVAIGYDTGDVAVWNVATNSPVAEFQGHKYRIDSLAWSPDGSELVTVGGDFVVNFWETTSYTRIHSWIVDTSFDQVMWSPVDPNIIALVDLFKVQVLDVTTSEVLLTYEIELGTWIHAIWSVDGSRIAVIDQHNADALTILPVTPRQSPTTSN